MAASNGAMSAHASKVSHARHERAPLVIAGAIILVIFAAAFGLGDHAIFGDRPDLVIHSSEATNSVGRAFYPLDDGTDCRDIRYDLASGKIIGSAVQPCAEGARAGPRRKFIWGR